MFNKSLLALSVDKEEPYPKPPVGYGTAEITIGHWKNSGRLLWGFNDYGKGGGKIKYYGKWPNKKKYEWVHSSFIPEGYFFSASNKRDKDAKDFYVEGIRYVIDLNEPDYQQDKINILGEDWKNSVGQTRFLWLPLL